MDIRAKIAENHARADYNVIEPGDGTRYTTMHTFLKDGIFIAIGAGYGIEGGYYVPSIKGVVDALKKAAWEQGDMIDVMKEQAAYYRSHTGIKNEWTCIVAVLLAVIFGSPMLSIIKTDLIKNVYRGDHRGVFEELSKV